MNESINEWMNACIHPSIKWNGMEWNEMKGIHDTQMHIGAMAKTWYIWYVACGHPSWKVGIHTWINQSKSLEKCIDCDPEISKG